MKGAGTRAVLEAEIREEMQQKGELRMKKKVDCLSWFLEASWFLQPGPS